MSLQDRKNRAFVIANPARDFGEIRGYAKIGKSQSATLFIGRKTGLSYAGKKEGQKLTTKEVKRVLEVIRGKQIGKEKVGLSVVEQLGTYKGRPEKSLQTTIIYDGADGTVKDFEKNVIELAETAATKLAQREIIIRWETDKQRGIVSSATPKEAPNPNTKEFCRWVKKHSKKAKTDPSDDCY